MQRFSPKWLAAVLLVIMGLLMVSTSRQDSATVDETTHLAAGYTYWLGHKYRMAANHPALSQQLEALPLLAMNIKMPETADAILKGRLGYPWMLPWSGPPTSIQPLLPFGCRGKQVQLPPLGDVLALWDCPSAYPIDNWWYWAVPECQMFSKYLFYGGVNNGDAMLFAGRVMQTLLTLLTGFVIFLWVRRATGNDQWALFALALWTFNPTAIAYGRLTNTDIGVTLGMTLALYLWARFLETPTTRLAVLTGVATGIALTMKFTAILLAPIFVVTLALSWKRLSLPATKLGKLAGLALFAMWATIMVVYFPRWTPAPPPTLTEVAVLNPPGWFVSLRPLLIPADFWKVIAMALAKSGAPTSGYLFGSWSDQGRWYYFPATFALKSSATFVLLALAGIFIFAKRARACRPIETVTWVAGAIYLGVAMTSNINLGVRHLLPVLALFCVGIGCAAASLAQRRLQLAAWVLAGGQAVSCLFAYPLYIQYFSELVGGAPNGYRYLVDSNYDWGQDAHRLKAHLDRQGIQHIYLNYFGTQFSTEFLKIPNTRVGPEQARQIREGYLVVSVSELMQPHWAWLRETRQPIARVAHTLWVYRFPQ